MNRELVAQLRKYTGQPVIDCKEILADLPVELAEAYVQYYSEHSISWFIDPKKKKSKKKKGIEEGEKEGGAYLESWKKKRLAEFESSGMEHRTFRGASHIKANEKQRVLKENHGVSWKTPSQMNKNVVFD
ncbi:MAG: hypothetical protein AAES65_03040 [Candidatus Thiodiazotropha sp. (ex. Lucinoma kazani)]